MIVKMRSVLFTTGTGVSGSDSKSFSSAVVAAVLAPLHKRCVFTTNVLRKRISPLFFLCTQLYSVKMRASFRNIEIA
jgi:hypothetical protein